MTFFPPLKTTLSENVIAAGERHNVFVPRFYKPNATITPVIFCHHYSGGSWTAYYGWSGPTGLDLNYNIALICQALAYTGRPVIATDMGGQFQWPTATVMARMDGALAQVASQTGCRSDRALLFAVSMGGAVALNWARRNPSKTAALAAVIPVPNITYFHDNVDANNIDTSYGSHAAYLAAMPDYDPNLAAANSWSGIPIKMWTSSNDTTAPPAVTAAFATRIGIEAPGDMGAHGHTVPDSLDQASLINFLLSHA